MDMAVLMDQRAVLGGPAGVVPDVDAERRAAGPDIDVGERVALAVREQAETGDRGEGSGGMMAVNLSQISRNSSSVPTGSAFSCSGPESFSSSSTLYAI